MFPYRTFTWKGIDGTPVLVHMAPEGDYNSRGAADGLLTGLRQYPEKALNTALLKLQFNLLGMNRYLANAIAIAAVTGWNFYLNLKLSWRVAEPEQTPAT